MSRTRSALQVREAAPATGAGLPRLVPGTVVVAFLIGLGRWGSYLGLPSKQLFVTDVLLAVSTVYTVVRYRQAVVAHLGRALRSRVAPVLPVLALLVWALVRGLPGLTSADGLRDLAPYVYVGVMALIAVLPRTPGAARATVRVLVGALVVHAAWVSFSQLWPDRELLAGMPLLGGMVRVLEIRVDYDGAVLGVLAGLALYGLSRVRRTAAVVGLSAVLAWSVFMVLLLPSRASLIAAVLACGAGCLSSFSLAERLWRNHRRIVVGGLVAVVAAMLVIIPQTPTYKRLSGAPGYVPPSGTTAARQAAWSAVINYIDQEPSRVVAGVGMGPDFLKASGASVHYQDPGAPIVRQPHNYAINTYARLGVVGVGLLLWVLAGLVKAVALAVLRSVRRDDAETALDITCVLLCSVLLTTSMLGVILESPFGAIPFGWATGLLLVRARTAAVPAGAAHP